MPAQRLFVLVTALLAVGCVQPIALGGSGLSPPEPVVGGLGDPLRGPISIEGRKQWLQRTLLERERPTLEREPEIVAEKFRRMARDTFAFYRGTSWLVPREASRFVGAARQVAVIGDPHPENVALYVTGDGTRLLDFNDFDAAGFGSYVDDIRRLAVSLWIVADMADLPRSHRARVVEEVVLGYAAEIQALASGRPAIALRADTAFGGQVEGLLEEVEEPTGAGGAIGSQATAEDRRLVAAVLPRYAGSVSHPAAVRAEMLTVKQVERRHIGVASFNHLRLRVLVDGPTSDRTDDWMLELKESIGTAADCIVAIQRGFQERSDQDPLLGWATLGERQFRVRRILPEQRRLDVRRIVTLVRSPHWKKSDLRRFAFDLGRLLARGHARARGADGQPGLPTIVRALTTVRGLAYETTGVASRQADATEADLDLLRALVREDPLLGWRR